jgi:large subunit ribosomal protein L10
MYKPEKIKYVEALKEELKDINCLYLFQFSKVSVPEDNELRMKIGKTGGTYRVIKNSLLEKATEGTDLHKVTKGLVQPTVVAFTKEDPVSLAKVLKEFAKEKETYFFKGGILEGQVLSEDDFNEVATMPSKEDLIAKLLFLLQSPVQGLVTALEGIYRQLPVVLNQISEKKEN